MQDGYLDEEVCPSPKNLFHKEGLSNFSFVQLGVPLKSEITLKKATSSTGVAS